MTTFTLIKTTHHKFPGYNITGEVKHILYTLFHPFEGKSYDEILNILPNSHENYVYCDYTIKDHIIEYNITNIPEYLLNEIYESAIDLCIEYKKNTINALDVWHVILHDSQLYMIFNEHFPHIQIKKPISIAPYTKINLKPLLKNISLEKYLYHIIHNTLIYFNNFDKNALVKKFNIPSDSLKQNIITYILNLIITELKLFNKTINLSDLDVVFTKIFPNDFFNL